MGFSKSWYETRCDKHGKVEADDKANLRRVTVKPPMTKKARYNTGCPICHVEKLAESKTESNYREI